MAKDDVDTYYEEGQWKNKVRGNSRASHPHATKAEAQKVGRDMARERESEHTIKNKDGKIGKGSGSKQSYGSDNTPPAG